MNDRVTQTAKIYANALFELTQDSNQLLTQIKQVEEVFVQSQDLYNLLSNPSVDISVKYEILDSVFEDKIDKNIINFLKILAQKERIKEFSQIVNAYQQNFDKKNNVKLVEIISAIELGEDYKQKIIQKLEQKLNSSINTQWTINPEIIGGLIFRCNDVVIDSSVAKQIENFGKIIK